jgi:hypothetical protein
MKTLVQALLLSCALSAPALAFAQSDAAPVTRAEVRADLVRVHRAGYSGNGSDPYYPDDIQAAEAKIAAQDHANEVSSVGGTAQTGATQAGLPQALDAEKSLYAHH